MTTSGLHHITAICSTPKENKRFYTEVLGLAFIKNTVNHDDPGTYHLYYGGTNGDPGLLMTFFTWTHLPQAMRGSGETSRIFFGVPKGSFSFWKKRFLSQNIQFEENINAFDTPQLLFTDPHGLPLGLQEQEEGNEDNTRLDKKEGINGFCSVEFIVQNSSETASVLKTLGYVRTKQHDSTQLFLHPDATFAKEVILREDGSLPLARQGIGSVHHVAFGIEFQKQEEFLKKLVHKNYHPSPIIDRVYFKSIYFRDPQGILFEIATNGPGFFEDEDILGSTFVLPPHLEPYRKEIISALPPLD